MSQKERLINFLDEFSDEYQETMSNYEKESLEYWNSLPYDEQCKAFYAVTKKIMKAESEGSSYRGVIYDEFEFEPDMYGVGMSSRFFDMHNILTMHFMKYEENYKNTKPLPNINTEES